MLSTGASGTCWELRHPPGAPRCRKGPFQAGRVAIAGGPPDKEAQLLESWKAYKTGFQQGIALFNKKPKKGIAFMQEQVPALTR